MTMTIRISILILTILGWSSTALANNTDSALGSVAVLEFNTSDHSELQERSEAFATLLATQLSSNESLQIVANDQVKATLTVEVQRELLGGGKPEQIAPLADSLGVRYLVFGRMDRFGDLFVLTAAAHDTQSAQVVRRWRRDLQTLDVLPTIANDLGLELGNTIVSHLKGLPIDSSYDPALQFDPRWHLNVDIGKTVPQLSNIEFSSLTLAIDLEADWYFSPHIQGFIEVGLSGGKAENEEANAAEGEQTSSEFKLVPAALGCKYLFTPYDEWRPYVGIGLGVGLISGFFDESGKKRQILPNLEGRFGLGYFPFQRVGFDIETSVNLNGGVDVDGKDSLMVTFNASLGVVVLF